MAGARPDGRFSVLVLGGTGVFGSKLCRLLAGDPQIVLTVAARNAQMIEALATELGCSGLVVDWQKGLDETLDRCGYDALVHIAGPFQGQDYRVAEACVRHRVHYLDLSDDRAFVCGIDRLDALAKSAGLLVCSGASTAPALTSAVVDIAIQKRTVIDRVAFAIVPGNDAPRGRALVEAILSGAGKPIADQPGRHVWGSLRRLRVPGLGRRWVAACDLPEPAVFARQFAIRDTYAGAGLELSVMHFGLWLLAWPVRLGLLRSLAPLTAPLSAVADALRRFGTDRGGLRIDLEGPGGKLSWCLIAEGGDGPLIPALPAAALIRKLARGAVGSRGAMPCVGLLSLPEIEEEWRRAGLRIAAGWGDDGAELSPSLYRRALGTMYDRLPIVCQTLHDSGSSIWKGRCTVDGARTLLGRLVSWLFQMPPASRDVPIQVEFTVHDGRETWTRRVAGRAMRSQQYIGVRRPRGSIVERFGPFAFDLVFPVADDRLMLVMIGARVLGVPLPRLLWPKVAASESGADGRFNFDVDIGLPLVGRLVRYRGWLTSR